MILMILKVIKLIPGELDLYFQLHLTTLSSINTNDSTHSSTPVMMLSDDLLSNPACWPTHHANRIYARLLSLTELPQ
jgi:hypothetical protein